MRKQLLRNIRTGLVLIFFYCFVFFFCFGEGESEDSGPHWWLSVNWASGLMLLWFYDARDFQGTPLILEPPSLYLGPILSDAQGTIQVMLDLNPSLAWALFSVLLLSTTSALYIFRRVLTRKMSTRGHFPDVLSILYWQEFQSHVVMYNRVQIATSPIHKMQVALWERK